MEVTYNVKFDCNAWSLRTRYIRIALVNTFSNVGGRKGDEVETRKVSVAKYQIIIVDCAIKW